MFDRRRFFVCLVPFIAAVHTSAASAQGYPAKPITFFVPFAAGSATDYLARALGQGVTAETKQNIVVDNRPGASGFIATQAVVKAAPDGYSVLIATNTTHAANEHLFKNTGIEPFVTTSAELAKFQAAESAKWAKVIKAAGIEPE